MKKSKFLKAVIISALAISVSPIAANSADHSHHNVSHHAQASTNALVEEMKALDSVFREIVSSVALGDGPRVHQALEGMHGRMEKTQEALHAGHVTLRKNADKIADFEKADKAFHADLEKLAKAAHKGDQREMTRLTKRLLDSCVACHNKFRP